MAAESVPTPTLVRVANGVDIADARENGAGWTHLTLLGAVPPGAVVTLAHAEMRRSDGSALTNQFPCANRQHTCVNQTDTYVAAGGGGAGAVETWQPRFTWHGFRYVEIRGCPLVRAESARNAMTPISSGSGSGA